MTIKSLNQSELIGIIADDMDGIKTKFTAEESCLEIVRRQKILISKGLLSDGGSGRKFKKMITE